MKIAHILLICLLISWVSEAQNITPNSNFSIYSSCPTSTGQLEKCTDWFNVSSGTPDYFNVCHDTLTGSHHNVGIPDNMAGSQTDGNGCYAGLLTLLGTSNYREYIGMHIPSLAKGAVYQVLLKISLGENSLWATSPPSVAFGEKLDTFFAGTGVIDLFPLVRFDTTYHITDKSNWTILIDTFVADSAYTYLFIGNFKDDAATSKTVLTSGALSQAYYYIDSVAVEKIANSSGIDDINGFGSLTISPNPSSGTFTISLPTETKSDIVVTDIAGRVVRQLAASGEAQVSLDVPSGIYIVAAYTQSGVLRQRVVVRK
jgi:OmpA-OmpF porin, OOP family